MYKMAYSATKNSSGAYDILNNGTKISSGSAGVLGNYGLSESNLGGGVATTGIGANTGGVAAPTVSSPAVSTVAPTSLAVPPTPVAPIPPTNTPIAQTPAINTGQPSPTTVNATPYTGNSIVDALKSGGQASDFASRSKLAQTYGIQGYTGTADQNTALLQKYQQAHATAQSSGIPAPSAAGAGSAAVNDITGGKTPTPQVNPIDTVLAQDPGYQKLMADYKTYTDSTSQRTSLVDEYKKLQQDAGLPELNAEAINYKNVIDGTEDDIRNEITKAGGFATESQVLALTGARNKGLIKNYNKLVDTIQNATSNVNTMIGLSQQDRDYADQQFKTQLDFDNQVMQYQQKMQSNATDAYNNIIKSVGYAGLYNATGGDSYQVSLIEKTLGLQPGGLQGLANYTPPQSEEDKLNLDLKRSQLATDKLQRQKITQDLNTGPAVSTQVVDVNGKKLLINTKTGETINEIGGGDNQTNVVAAAQSKGNIDLISGLVKNGALNSAVGPNALARLSPLASINGTKSNFIAGVQQLTSQLTLDSLVRAKAQGATFGALSEGELNLLSGSATKLNNWAVKDKNGNVTGYSATEGDFKKELDKINNYAKLDYILKGGDPTEVDVQTMPDGTLVTKNSDGTYTQF